jgi:DnaJ-class molecular chaperone
LSCFGASVGGGRHKLQVCPGCYTLGARWNQDSSDWEECQACEGAGYLSKNPSRE